MLKRYLLAPGPTPVPPEVLLAMARPIIHHRAPEFAQIFGEVREDLKWLFQTTNDVLIFASSGTGGMEGAVSNFLSPGDKAVVVNGGKFGERWGKLCKTFGVQVIEIKVEWGHAVNPQAVADALKKDPSIKAVFVQASETSTGVAHPTKALAEVVKQHEGTILVVDAITALGVFDIQTDAWGIDVNVTGSQKALMLPPGLAFVSVSDKAWAKIDQNSNARAFYFDLKKYRDNLNNNDTPFTPAHTLIKALRTSLKMIRAEGIENVWARHARMAAGARAGAQGLGMELFAAPPANGLPRIKVPEGSDGTALLATREKQYGLKLAGGQDTFRGKIIRLAH